MRLTDNDRANRRKSPTPRYVRSKFVRDVYGWGFVLTGVLTMCAFPFGVKTSISILAGTAFSLLFFWTLEQMLRWLLDLGRKRLRWRIVAWVVFKYMVAGFLLYQIVRRDWIRVGAFAFGLCILYMSVVMALIVHSRKRFA